MSQLEKGLRWIVIGGVFALPLIVFIVAYSLFFPYIVGKNLAFRIIVEVITGAWLALALANPAYRMKRNWLLGAFALFIVVVAIADMQGAYPFKSFWSNYERMDGWITQIHLFLYFVVAYCTLNTEKLWRTLLQYMVGISVAVAVYGFLQLIGAVHVGQGGKGLEARIDVSFGNPIYLAAYMLFHIFIAAYLWIGAMAEGRRENRTWTSVLYGGAIVLDTIVLFFTGTRGTILGLAGGAVIAALLYAFLSIGSGRAKKIATGVILAIVIGTGAIYLGRDTPLVKGVGFLQRLSTISFSDATIKSRFLNMGMAWKGVMERPLFGWGQENYALVFDKYYDPRMYAQEQWFDRVHNIIFDWLIAAGFVGLLSYMSILLAALWAIWRRGVFSIGEQSVLTGMLAAYFFHDLFVFDNITSYVLFVTMLAFIGWKSISKESPKPVWNMSWNANRMLPIVVLVLTVVTAISVWYVNEPALAANKALLQAIAPQSGLDKNLAYFKQSIAYGTYGTQEAREQLTQGAAQLAGNKDVSDDIKKGFLETAANEMQKQEKASPLDARFPLFLSVLLDAYGDHADAKTALLQALALSPKKQTILYQLASNAAAQGDGAGALDYFKQAFDLETDNLDARLYYAATAIRLSNDALADQLLSPVISTGGAADQRILAAYVSRGRYDKIIPIWEAYVKAQPDDAQGYYTLAAAYYSAHDSADAISTLQNLEARIPDTKSQADSLIGDIRSGKLNVQ